MDNSEQKTKDLIKAAKPLLKYINENLNPHVTVIVTPSSVELLESAIYEENIFNYLVD